MEMVKSLSIWDDFGSSENKMAEISIGFAAAVSRKFYNRLPVHVQIRLGYEGIQSAADMGFIRAYRTYCKEKGPWHSWLSFQVKMALRKEIEKSFVGWGAAKRKIIHEVNTTSDYKSFEKHEEDWRMSALEDKDELNNILSGLPLNIANVISLRLSGKQTKDIGKIIGRTKERVQQLIREGVQESKNVMLIIK